MANIRIEVFNKCEQVSRRRVVNVYLIYISKELPSKLHEEICGLFYNKAIQDCRYYSYNENLEEVQYNFIESQAKWGLEISFLPGMTDNVGNTAKQIVREYLMSKRHIDESVSIKARSSKLILSQGGFPTEDDIKQEFNPITEYCTLFHKENGNCHWKYYSKQNTPVGVITARDQKKRMDSSVKHWDDTR